MAYVDLAVTNKVIRQVKKAGMAQRQIAIKGASEDLQAKIGTANKNDHVLITIGPGLELMVGDTGRNLVYSSKNRGAARNIH
jgi:hypothetical protein